MSIQNNTMDRRSTVDNEDRRDIYDTPCLCMSSSACDICAVCCATPLILLSPCAYVCQGPYSFMNFPPPKKRTSFDPLDNWYRASIFSLHGGSILQLIATQSLYWNFPLVSRETDYNVHDINVEPSNVCGMYCFAPIVKRSNSKFRIRKMSTGVYSVRLTSDVCGCCVRDCTGAELNDAWRISDNGRIITSLKTRGHVTCCNDYCVTMSSTGPAMFVAADPKGPTFEDVIVALQSTH
jgi:hypothetical protein